MYTRAASFLKKRTESWHPIAHCWNSSALFHRGGVAQARTSVKTRWVRGLSFWFQERLVRVFTAFGESQPCLTRPQDISLLPDAVRTAAHGGIALLRV